MFAVVGREWIVGERRLKRLSQRARQERVLERPETIERARLKTEPETRRNRFVPKLEFEEQIALHGHREAPGQDADLLGKSGIDKTRRPEQLRQGVLVDQ